MAAKEPASPFLEKQALCFRHPARRLLLPYSSLHKETIQEGHDLTTGAVIIRPKESAADAAGDAVLFGPSHRISIVAAGRYIAERSVAGNFGRTGVAIQEGYALTARADSFGAELAALVGNNIFASCLSDIPSGSG